MSVVALHVSPATRLDMRAVESIELTTGHGIAGDRYENTRHRHVTIQSSAELAEAARVFGAPIDPGLTRRNVTVSEAPLPTVPGSRIDVGEVTFEVVRIAAPCKLMDFIFGDDAKVALRRRAGVVCRTVRGGTITIGDPVALPLIQTA
jgi:MOSC domain-containing protein YiiM